MAQVRDVSIDRLDAGARTRDRDRVVVEGPLELRARGTSVATIMRTPGHDAELVRGLLHAESIEAASVQQIEDDTLDIDVAPDAFAGRGLLATAACGVCGRVAIADLELKAREVTADTSIEARVIAAMPDVLRRSQAVFAETGGLHGAGLFRTDGALVASREDVGRHNAVDKLVGWALGAGVDPRTHVLFLSGRLGYELVQKAVRFGVPIVGAVSAPSSLAIELAERFGIATVAFVRGPRCNVYSHGWRIR